MTTIASPHSAGLLQEYGLHPKKSLGQNFLVDGNILKKIADASKVTADDYIVEIARIRVLTRELAERSRGSWLLMLIVPCSQY
jgi:16S rRNA (adenine1518-N6/adenine1519-N6)-dimethyltransferase